MASHLVAGTVVADRFRLVRPLGQGGMGEVWLAHHLSLDIPCAIKFIFGEAASSPELRARFDREARAAAQLRSANVVQVLDNGVWQDAPYIAMELLEGEDLAQRLERVGRLDPAATVAILGQVARALAKAHGAGLVHRDLKPANIFLVRDDDQEIAKVLDFGIAKSNNLSLGEGALSKTKTGSLLGTPVYMSPEQAQGTKTVDHRSDLWSLAVVAFECLTGRLPFESAALGDLFMKIMVEPLPIPSQRAPLPPAVDAWWARAAARNPDHRFQSAKELVDALAASLGLGEPSAIGLRLSGPFSSAALSMPGAMPSAPYPDPTAAHAATALSPQAPLGGPARPFTVGATVSAITPGPVPPQRRSLALPLAGALLSIGLFGGVAFLALRPSGVDPGADPGASPPASTPAPPSAAAPSTAPSVEITPATSTTAPSASSAAKPPAPTPKGPATAKPPPVKTKKPDFGI
ncbi:MAG: serine/threonine-protein kinase [Byssovorax sp.]